MTVPGRSDPGYTDTATTSRGQRQGSVSSRELRGLEPARPGGAWRGVAFVALFLLAIGVVAVVVFGPSLRDLAWKTARDNPSVVKLPLVGDLVRDRLGVALTTPAGTDTTTIPLVIAPGEGISQVGQALADAGLVGDKLAFEYLAVTQDIGAKLQTGSFNLNKAMTPQQIVDHLQLSPDPPLGKVAVFLRKGLRLEQIAAYLQTLHLDMDVNEFYQMTQNPPAAILADYPALKELPKGRSLEGFMGSLSTSVDSDITPDAMLRMLLDSWQNEVGLGVIQEANQKHLDFYKLLTIASIVERETAVDNERAKIAGVYTNRLDPNLNPTQIMNADPTVVYAVDTQKLDARDFTTWPQYKFWTTVGKSLSTVQLPDELSSYQTYVNPGLPDGPIDSPTLPSIQAAMSPEHQAGAALLLRLPGVQDPSVRQDAWRSSRPTSSPAPSSDRFVPVMTDLPVAATPIAGRGRSRALAGCRPRPRGRRGWPGFGRASKPRTWTPTSGSAPSTRGT